MTARDGEAAIVIGAGAAGLAAADALARRGIRAVILEKEERLAEPWRRRHDHLALNTHRAMSALPGMPYPSSASSFPDKQEVIDYLEAFAARRGLAIEFGRAVEKISRDGGGWAVRTATGVRHAANVIVATGRDREPWMPDWEGAASFRGRLVHAAAFGNRSDYAGKRVLVVGAGNSGFDALNHLTGAGTAKLWLAARRGPTILPKRFLGLAVHRFSRITDALPLWLGDAVVATIQRLAFGNLARYGLPPAPKGGASRLRLDQIAIAADDGAVAALKKGRIEIVAPVARFLPDGVVLADGSTLDAEVVIAATGYRTGLEGMAGDLGVLDADGTPRAEPGRPSAPGLWFISMRPSIVGHFYGAGREARAIAAQIASQAP